MTTKQCPHCGFFAYNDKEISENFGWRINRDKKIPQSYCYTCMLENKQIRYHERKLEKSVEVEMLNLKAKLGIN